MDRGELRPHSTRLWWNRVYKIPAAGLGFRVTIDWVSGYWSKRTWWRLFWIVCSYGFPSCNERLLPMGTMKCIIWQIRLLMYSMFTSSLVLCRLVQGLVQYLWIIITHIYTAGVTAKEHYLVLTTIRQMTQLHCEYSAPQELKNSMCLNHMTE